MIQGLEVSDEIKDLWKKLCFQKLGYLVFRLSEDFSQAT